MVLIRDWVFFGNRWERQVVDDDGLVKWFCGEGVGKEKRGGVLTVVWVHVDV